MMRRTGYSKRKVVQVLEENGIDLLISSSAQNVFYTSGIPSRYVEHNPTLFDVSNQYPYFVITDREGNQTLVCWGVALGIPTWVKDIRPIWSREESIDTLMGVMKEKAGRHVVVGVESTLPFPIFERMRNAKANVRTADELFSSMRLHKSKDEIAQLRRANEITEKALTSVADALRPGITDIEVLEIAKTAMIGGGAAGWTGLSMAMPRQHEFAPGTGMALHRGDFVGMDFGAVVGGYSSDIFRLATLGTPSRKIKKVFEMALATQQACYEALRPGIRVQSIFSLAKETFAKLGGRMASHMVGHSIGIETEEPPLIEPGATLELAPTMVFNLEVIEWVGRCRVGIEDMYLIGEKKTEKLTSIPQQIFEG